MELVGKCRGVVSVQRGKVVLNHMLYIIIDNNIPLLMEQSLPAHKGWKNALALTGFYVLIQKCHLYITYSSITIPMTRRASEDKLNISFCL